MCVCVSAFAATAAAECSDCSSTLRRDRYFWLLNFTTCLLIQSTEQPISCRRGPQTQLVTSQQMLLQRHAGISMPVQMLLYLLFIRGRREVEGGGGRCREVEGGGGEGRGCLHSFAGCFFFPSPVGCRIALKAGKRSRRTGGCLGDGHEPKQPLTCC